MSGNTYTYQSLIDRHKSAQLIISVLQRRHFDRPCYNKQMLDELFSMYQSGNSKYHELFKTVFYIELWHLLFVDQDTSILSDTITSDMSSLLT